MKHVGALHRRTLASWLPSSLFRIAVPALRSETAMPWVRHDPAALSREEVAALFRNDLRAEPGVSDSDQGEKDLARRIRAALYSR